ncbi:unnamed protein product [Medioppia subpectinata]|uniref:ABC-2 type transporter transmembrane domain-containing protein n=1 Tax=Medioppia subpectinata TaxID=1979941 RepID=A0A7R9Q0T1_9ACAR|nr:unnamed protein product [Medioppia subpectinata]CAG2107634.1 unnamed protein product [Medioppia subpectinata]
MMAKVWSQPLHSMCITEAIIATVIYIMCFLIILLCVVNGIYVAINGRAFTPPPNWLITITAWMYVCGIICSDLHIINNMTTDYSRIISDQLTYWGSDREAVADTKPRACLMCASEYRNGWYSVYSYYMAKVLVDVFWQLTIPLLLIVPAFVGTGQYWETERWRFYYFIGICLLLALSFTSMGLIVSAYLMDSPTAVAFIGIVTAFPLFLFSGFMIPVKDMPNGFRHSTWGNFIRFTLEGTTTAIYGFNRCRADPIGPKKAPIDWGSLITEEQMTAILASDHINADALMNTMSLFSGQVSDEAQSVIMTKMDYHDNDMYRAC